MLLTGTRARVFQIHATRSCNLRCAHCYSSSGPEERDSLSFPLIRDAIADAAKLGYNVISFSGGEPLIRKDLALLAQEAHAQQLAVTLVTNGLLLTEQRMAELKRSVDMIAISLDGAPERHNRMRGLPNAFEKVKSNLRLLREADMAFGFVFTLSQNNLHELEWAADFAHREGALLFQVHPLELMGRAARQLAGEELDEEATMRAWLLVQWLRCAYEGQMIVEADLANALSPPISPEDALLYAHECLSGGRQFAHFLSPLVLEADGEIVPLRYSFPKCFSLGSLKDNRLAHLTESWAPRLAVPLSELYGSVLKEVLRADSVVFNLYERITCAASTQETPSLMAAFA